MTDRDRTRLRPAALSPARPEEFALTPDAARRAEIAARLGIEGIRKLSFRGTLRAAGREDWVLDAVLGATVIQTCVVTLAPVTTRIDEKVHREYLAHMPRPPEGEEVEMPEDDTQEQLPEVIDLANVMEEALALALPPYPRADGAELEEDETIFAPPGVTPMRDEDAKPLAGLAALKKRLEKGNGTDTE